MNFNKCSRCGSFFLSNSNVCPNCQPKEDAEIACLSNFINENENENSFSNIENIAEATGISLKNLNRFLSMDNFSVLADKVKENNGNTNINL